MTTSLRSNRRERSDRLARVAGKQFGAFAWAQAIWSGYPESTFTDLVRDGMFRRLQPEVYVAHTTSIGLDTCRAAALLSAGDDTALIRRSALHLYACTRFGSRAIQIGSPRRRRRRLRNATIEVCPAAALGHVTTFGGHRVTTFAWTVTDLGTELEPEQIAHVIHQGRLRGFLQLEALDRVLSARGNFRGVRNVRRALEMYRSGSAGTRSHDEDLVYGWVKTMLRQPPLPNVHVQAGDQEFEIDIPFLSRKLCVEVDGPMHDDPDQRIRDRVRDDALRAAGFQVLRLHWRDIRDRPEWCRRRLAAALRR